METGGRRLQLKSRVVLLRDLGSGQWWEVFKEKQQREQKENNKTIEPIDEGKYDQILETFAQKLVKKQRPNQAYSSVIMPAANAGILHNDPSPTLPTSIPPWLSKSTRNPIRSPSPSVTLTLSTSSTEPSPTLPWLLQTHKLDDTMPSPPVEFGNLPVHHGSPVTHGQNIPNLEILECCRDLEENHRLLMQQKKEASWRLSRIQLQLESEKACRMREKMEEMEAKVKGLREEERTWMDKIEAEYREQIVNVRQEVGAKELKLAEEWTSKHLRLKMFLDHLGSQ